MSHFKRVIIGPPATFRWHADECPTLNAGLAAAIFRGSGPVWLENPLLL